MSKLKNTILIFLFLFFLFQIVFVISTESSVLAEDIVYGDVNLDGEVDSFDFAMMRKYLLGKIKEFDNDRSIKAADVNGDGVFNSLDFALMKKYLLGKIKVFPVYQNSIPTPTASPSEFTKIIPFIVDVEISDANRNSIVLSWDEVEGAVSYEVFRDDVSIGTTSNTYFADLRVIEGKEHVYKIKAVNDLGESSQFSSGVIVNTSDTVIDSDTVLSEDRYYINLNLEDGAKLDLNGYVLNVKGDFLQINGGININSGSLKNEGNYSIDRYGLLEMAKEKDYVFVGGDFSTFAFYWDENLLSAGILEIKGNISSKDFRATGSHKVVLSGEREQEIDKGIQINELEIRNEKGVKIESAIRLNKMKGNYKVIEKFKLLGDVILEGDVTIEGDLELLGGVLDLSGYSLKVTGDFEQFAEFDFTYVKINGGYLEINGDYSMYSRVFRTNSSKSVWESVLEMNDIEDYVYVGGDFTTYSGETVYISPLKAGIMEVKGDFTSSLDYEQYLMGRYQATGSHKVILSGDKEQAVNIRSSWLRFNELEIQNEKGVKIDGMLPIEEMQGKYKFIDDAFLIIGSIIGDVEIDGNLVIVDQEIDLAGYTLTINGNLDQASIGLFFSQGETCKIKVNGGSLIVNGDYSIGYKKISDKHTDESYIASAGEAGLEMTNENDYVYVGGDFSTRIGKSDVGVVDYYLTAGVMEVKGNFICDVDWDYYKFGKFVATGSHKVILSGDKEQVVYNYSGWLMFNELEIKNEKGVRFYSSIPISKMKGHYKVLGEAQFRIDSIIGDVVIDGNVTLMDQVVDLAGHSLTITGNLNQYSAGRIYTLCDTPFLSKIKINGGSLKVNGNYTIGYYDRLERFDVPGSILEMTNETDYVYVGGDFTMASIADNSDCLTAGTLEVKGNFTQSGSPSNFAASRSHKTILSGDTVQTVNFEYPETSSFNILKLTKPLDIGYIFNTTPVWKTLEE